MPATVFHTRHAGHQLLTGHQQDVVVQGTVLPPTLEQLPGDQQGGLGPFVLEDELTDNRAALTLGNLNPGRSTRVQTRHDRRVSPDREHAQATQVRALPHVQGRHYQKVHTITTSQSLKRFCSNSDTRDAL